MTSTDIPDPYVESEDHVPNPMYQSGVVDTTGTTGEIPNMDRVSGVFREARAAALGHAVEALDNEGASTAHVHFPESDKTRDEAEADLRDAAAAAKDALENASGRSDAELEAAQEGEGKEVAEGSGANMLHSGAGPRPVDDRSADSNDPAEKSTDEGKTTTGPTGPAGG